MAKMSVITYSKLTRQREDLLKELVEEQNNQTAAAKYGDLSENHEYEVAKTNVNRINTELNRIDKKLNGVEIVDTLTTNTFQVGSIFHMLIIREGGVSVQTKVAAKELSGLDITEEAKQDRLYLLDADADIQNDIISVNSALGKMIVGKKSGQYNILSDNGRTVTYQVTLANDLEVLEFKRKYGL